MLTPLDETLAHQTPNTFDHVYTSDHRFFDRNWFCAYSPDGAVGVITGIGTYSNMNVCDGFAAVQHGRRQHNVRASRRLRPRIEDLAVGPVRHEIVEPLQTHRLILEPAPERAVSFDLTWDGTAPPHEEPHHFGRLDGRAYEDFRRFDQVGAVRGHVEVDGAAIAADGWFGARDHSWGIRRSIGGFEPFTGSLPRELAGILFCWLEFAAGAVTGHLQLHEDGPGNRLYLDGFVRDASTGRADTITDASVELSFVEGTRAYERAIVTATTSDGRVRHIEAEPLMTAWAYRGTGYDGGFADGRGLGTFRGDELVEHDVYDVSHPEDVTLPDGTVIRPLHREQGVRLTFDGAAGYGHFPVMAIGPLGRLGLADRSPV